MAAQELEGTVRIELCSRLDLEGLTPSVDDVRRARRELDLPFTVMIRPHAQGFVYDIDTLALMESQARTCLDLGASGIVVGPLCADGTIDRSALEAFVNLAEERDVVFHRAFDLASYPYLALETLADCGVTRVLTSGAAPTALEGARRIRALVKRAHNRLGVVACGKVRDETMRELIEFTGVSEVHRRYVRSYDTTR